MQGIERRSYGPGRRATDRQGARSAPWARILALAVAIALVAYALLVLREADRPRREAEAARIEALSLEARLAASQVEAQANRAALALRAGARALNQTPAQPAAALDHARGLAPEAAFMIVDAQGRILAASGARL
ncbi:PAS domain-containing sensor histidine kinase, partial [Brevundimonas sp. LPMIX5]